METVKFEVGVTYYTRSIGDHNCIFTIKVVKRTAKTVTVIVDDRETKTLRPSIYQGAESVKPHGSYSMAASIDATDTKILRPDWETIRA